MSGGAQNEHGSHRPVTGRGGRRSALVLGVLIAVTVPALSGGSASAVDGNRTVSRTAVGNASLAGLASNVTVPPIMHSPTIVPGEEMVTVRWLAPYSGDTPTTGFVVTVVQPEKTVTVGASARSVTITGLTDMQSYTIAVQANSDIGLGPKVSQTVIPRAHGQRIIATGSWDDTCSDLVTVSSAGVVALHRGNCRGGFTGSTAIIGRNLQDERILLPHYGPVPQNEIRTFWSVNYDGTFREHLATGVHQWNLNYEYALSRGWTRMSKVFSSDDWSGDGEPDVMGVKDTGELYYYRHTNQDTLAAGVRLGSGWGGYRQLLGAGDQNGDHHPDILGLRTDGTIWLFPGNGHGGFAHRGYKIGSGFSNALTILSTDWNDDGAADLLTVDRRGYLRWYAGNARAQFTSRGVVGGGWGGYL